MNHIRLYIRLHQLMHAALQREKEGIIKKRKAMEMALQTIEKDMRLFQVEKQNGLNEIEIALTLYMHQVSFFFVKVVLNVIIENV